MDRINRIDLSLQPASEAMLPLVLAEWAEAARARIHIFAARDDAMLQRLTRELPVFAPGHKVLRLPAWDSLPYDRARPSRAVTGARVATLAWLTAGYDQPAILLTTPEAMPQRVPPRDRVRERSVPLRTGQELDAEWLRATLVAFGYGFDDRVDEPGEAAIRGGAVDVHMAGADTPVRLELDAGRIASIRWFDPATQRSIGDADQVLLLPTTEAFTVPGEEVPREAREQLLPDGELETIFDYVPDAAFALTDSAWERFETWSELVRDSFELARSAGTAHLVAPNQLYLGLDELQERLGRYAGATVVETDEVGDAPLAAGAVAGRVADARRDGDRVLLCGDAPADRLIAAVKRRLGEDAGDVILVADWHAAKRMPGQSVGVMRAPLRNGFAAAGIRVFALRPAERQADETVLDQLAGALRLDDLVVDRERGLARLDDLVMEEQAGAPVECLRLAFLGGDGLLLPAAEINRIWRYGASGTVKPDKLDAQGWRQRRDEIQREIEATASGLVQRMKARAERRAPVLERGAEYRRFVGRMPFAATPDQARAIRAIQQDLASGRPMYRLVCGDVGFGKTEVALHAAAIAAMAGKQVAVAAPTTVLARQHFETFRRRLGGFGIRVVSLIRSTTSTENRGVLRQLVAGEAQVVVGTHAVAAAKFHDLGLVIIDEEQRFGDAQKKRLRHVQDSAHALIMTATPLPRSLQSALVGLVDVSLLATPPAARLPVRGFVMPFDPVVVRAALLHETRRGGQSFVVCPRVEGLEPMLRQLQELTPELRTVVAHGKLPPDDMERVMLDFAEGKADVLLCTSIIEAGLDLPNANTMLIWRADRFGLSQLHQLRGRVGRGRVRAKVYLLTDPKHPPSAAAWKRLETVITLDYLGAGFAISMADLDQRGAGDLLGGTQAGHVRLIGTELYRDMLQRALARARGERVEEPWQPDIVLDIAAFVPPDFVPEPNARLGIYRQVAALDGAETVAEAAADLEDRFGDLPPPLLNLLSLARLRLACLRHGIARVQAGPAAVALTPRPGVDLSALADASISGERVILPISQADPLVRLRQILSVLGS